MSYIVVLNPAILAGPATGMPFDGVLAATVLVAVSMTLLMGVYAKLPFGVAPGMGLNAFLASTVIIQGQVAWQVALGRVFWAGVVFLAMSLTSIREVVAASIPPGLRAAAAAGIGLLLAFLGFRNAGIVVADPMTLVRIGDLDHRAALLVLGLVVAFVMSRRRNPLAFLAAIGIVTATSWMFGYAPVPRQLVSVPDIGSVLLRLDPIGALRLSLVPTIIAIAMTDLFDSLSTFVGVATASGMTDPDGRPVRLREGLIVDAWATLGASLFGSSPGTAYVESIAGIRMGGRTGRAAIVTALCFVPCYFLSPLVAAIPAWATAPILIVAGLAMFQTVQQVDFGSLEDSLPALVTLILIPLTFSITAGLLWGFLLHGLFYVLAGRIRDLSFPVASMSVTAAGLLLLEHLT